MKSLFEQIIGMDIEGKTTSSAPDLQPEAAQDLAAYHGDDAQAPEGKAPEVTEDAFSFISQWAAPAMAMPKNETPAPSMPPIDPADVDFRKSDNEQRCVACRWYDREGQACRVLRVAVDGDDLGDLAATEWKQTPPTLTNDEMVLLAEGLTETGAADVTYDGYAISQFGVHMLGEVAGVRFSRLVEDVLRDLTSSGAESAVIFDLVQAGRDS